MVGIEIRIRVLDRKREEFLQTAASLRAAGAGEGCVSVATYEEVGRPGHFLWVERWRDRGSLEAHLGNDPHRALRGAIRVLGELEELRLVEYPGPSRDDSAPQATAVTRSRQWRPVAPARNERKVDS
jgi:quinol monooxygenase YgiN